MQILISTPNIANPRGGGRISLRNLITKLSNDHQIFIFNYTNSNYLTSINFLKNEYGMKIDGVKNWELPEKLKKVSFPSEIKNYLIESYGSKKLKEYATSIDPDLIVLQGMKLSPPDRYRSIIFIRDFNFGHLNGKPLYKKFILAPFAFFRRRRINKIDLSFANSKYMQSIIQELFPKNSYVYPFIKIPKRTYKNNFNKNYIGYINPGKIKGVEIFLKIANKLQDRKFLVAGRTAPHYRKELEKLENIRYIGWQDDISNMLSKLKLLLIPSICEETFGRVAVEAASFSIPVIASYRGGLPEAAGNGGVYIKDIFNINDWIKSIYKFDNKNFYKEKSIKAYQHHKKYHFKNTYNNFQNILKQELNIEI